METETQQREQVWHKNGVRYTIVKELPHLEGAEETRYQVRVENPRGLNSDELVIYSQDELDSMAIHGKPVLHSHPMNFADGGFNEPKFLHDAKTAINHFLKKEGCTTLDEDWSFVCKGKKYSLSPMHSAIWGKSTARILKKSVFSINTESGFNVGEFTYHPETGFFAHSNLLGWNKRRFEDGGQTKKLVKLNRDYNGEKKDTIGEVVHRPNMFVTDIVFPSGKKHRIDNGYFEYVKQETFADGGINSVESFVKQFNSWRNSPAYHYTLAELNEKDIDYSDWTDATIFQWWLKQKGALEEIKSGFSNAHHMDEYEKNRDEQLKLAGYDVSKLSQQQKDLITERMDGPENYYQDGELSPRQAETYWVRKLKASGLSQKEIHIARTKFARGGNRIGRPSPAESATEFSIGTQRQGQDGNTWEIKADSRGVQRWVKVKGEATATRYPTQRAFVNMGDYIRWIEEEKGVKILDLTEAQIIEYLNELKLSQLVGTGSKENRVEKAAQMLLYAATKNVPDEQLTLEQYATKHFIGEAKTEAMFLSGALAVFPESYRAAWEKAKGTAPAMSQSDKVKAVQKHLDTAEKKFEEYQELSSDEKLKKYGVDDPHPDYILPAILQKLMPKHQQKFLKDIYYSEHVDTLNKLAENASQLKARNDKGAETIIYLHYFHGSADWYISGWQKGDGIFMGFANLFGDEQSGEWGSVFVDELTNDKAGLIELDFYFKPKPIKEINIGGNHYYSENQQQVRSSSPATKKKIKTRLTEFYVGDILQQRNDVGRLGFPQRIQILPEVPPEPDYVWVIGDNDSKSKMSADTISEFYEISDTGNRQYVVIDADGNRTEVDENFEPDEPHVEYHNREQLEREAELPGRSRAGIEHDREQAEQEAIKNASIEAVNGINKSLEEIIEESPAKDTGSIIAANNAANPLAEVQIQNADINRLAYEPESDACLRLNTNIPASMRFEMQKALANVDRRVNGVDEFVALKLGYINQDKCTPKQYKEGLQCLCDAFAAEQVDALAMTIYNIEEKKQGIIIGDMTGVGKGRVAAGVIRYAILNNIMPIFFTEKPNLFSDIYRDIKDIGSDDNIPLEFLKDEKRERTKRTKRGAVISQIKEDIDNGDYEEDFNAQTLFDKGKESELKQVIDVYIEKYFPVATELVDAYEQNKNYEKDIKGKRLVRPFIVNGSGSKTNIKDIQGNIIYKGLPANVNSRYLDLKQVPDGINLIVTTYSQIASERAYRKREFLNAFADNCIIVMDESHNASGDSNTGAYLKSLLEASKGCCFLSATYAKRPDNMPIYAAKTAMKDVAMDSENLVEAIKKGGVALQEVITSLLAVEGQLLRRERSFAGVEVFYHILDKSQDKIFPELNLEQEHIAIFDAATELLRETIKFQADHVTKKIKDMEKEFKAEQKSAGIKQGTAEAGISNPPMFSGVFNIINQLLFSVKAEAVALMAIHEIKAGRKPIIAFSSTMESFLDNFETEEGKNLKDGDIIGTDFAQVFMKRLRGILRFSTVDSEGNLEHGILNPADIGGEFFKEYQRIERKIHQATIGIQISPIDLILDIIRKAGYSVEEVTGRGRALKLISEGEGQVFTRPQKAKNDIFREFNENEVDCLLINQSGSTGVSAHAVPNKKVTAAEVKPRSMIVLQFELNINTEIQKRGRIHRTGQIYNPVYHYLTSAVPAEKRLNMMLQRKLKSLDANTTSNQKQSGEMAGSDIPDFLNKYGDDIVYDYLAANQDINKILGDPLHIQEAIDDGHDFAKEVSDAAYKVAGRVAILPVDMQDDFYQTMSENYESLVEALKQTEEYDLEVESMDLSAEVLGRQVAVVGTGDTSVFSRNSILEECEVNVLKKPFKATELEAMIHKSLSDGKGGQYPANRLKDILIEEAEVFNDKKKETELEISVEKHKNLRENVTKEKQFLKLLELGSTAAAIRKQNEYLEGRAEEIELGESYARNRITETWNNKKSNVVSSLRHFKIGDVLAYPSLSYGLDGTWSKAMFIGWDINRKARNPWAPGIVRMRLAFPSGKKYIAMPLSQRSIIDAIKSLTISHISDFADTMEATLEMWDEMCSASTKDRTIRYIVTGNILQAYGNDSLKGKLISYTTSIGTEKKGILLPETFSPTEVIKGEKGFRVTVPIYKAAPLIKSLHNEASLTTDNGIGIFRYTSDTFMIMVAASKKLGGRFYLNPAILKLEKTHEFNKVGSMMRGYIMSRNIDEFLKILQFQFSTNVELNAAQFEVIKDTIDIEVYADEEKFIPKENIVIEKLTHEGTEEQQQEEAEKQAHVTDLEKQNRILMLKLKMMKLLMMLK